MGIRKEWGKAVAAAGLLLTGTQGQVDAQRVKPATADKASATEKPTYDIIAGKHIVDALNLIKDETGLEFHPTNRGVIAWTGLDKARPNMRQHFESFLRKPESKTLSFQLTLTPRGELRIDGATAENMGKIYNYATTLRHVADGQVEQAVADTKTVNNMRVIGLSEQVKLPEKLWNKLTSGKGELTGEERKALASCVKEHGKKLVENRWLNNDDRQREVVFGPGKARFVNHEEMAEKAGNLIIANAIIQKLSGEQKLYVYGGIATASVTMKNLVTDLRTPASVTLAHSLAVAQQTGKFAIIPQKDSMVQAGVQEYAKTTEPQRAAFYTKLQEELNTYKDLSQLTFSFKNGHLEAALSEKAKLQVSSWTQQDADLLNKWLTSAYNANEQNTHLKIDLEKGLVVLNANGANYISDVASYNKIGLAGIGLQKGIQEAKEAEKVINAQGDMALYKTMPPLAKDVMLELKRISPNGGSFRLTREQRDKVMAAGQELLDKLVEKQINASAFIGICGDDTERAKQLAGVVLVRSFNAMKGGPKEEPQEITLNDLLPTSSWGDIKNITEAMRIPGKQDTQNACDQLNLAAEKTGLTFTLQNDEMLASTLPPQALAGYNRLAKEEQEALLQLMFGNDVNTIYGAKVNIDPAGKLSVEQADWGSYERNYAFSAVTTKLMQGDTEGFRAGLEIIKKIENLDSYDIQMRLPEGEAERMTRSKGEEKELNPDYRLSAYLATAIRKEGAAFLAYLKENDIPAEIAFGSAPKDQEWEAGLRIFVKALGEESSMDVKDFNHPISNMLIKMMKEKGMLETKHESREKPESFEQKETDRRDADRASGGMRK